MEGTYIRYPPTSGGGSEFDAGNSGSAITINFANGQTQVVTLTANTTISFANIQPATPYILRIKTGSGGFTASFSGISFGTPGAPIITAAGSKYDLINIYGADGVFIAGSYVQGFTD